MCDQCSKLIPVLEKGEVCQGISIYIFIYLSIYLCIYFYLSIYQSICLSIIECSFACHESCTKKVSLKCVGKGWNRPGVTNEVVYIQLTHYYTIQVSQTSNESNKSQFGVQLELLVPSGTVKVPPVLENCLTCIENNGII